MFILSEKTIGVPLSKINTIIITYFANKSDILELFDNNFNFDENIIPMTTSILERVPKIYNYKKYYCIDTNIIIKQNKTAILDNPEYMYPSFYCDINTLENIEMDISKINLINSVVNNIDNQLIRIYNNEKIHILDNTQMNDFTQNILNEKEYKKITWEFDWGCFDIIIDLIKKTCNYEITINIIEEHNIIHSRIIDINNKLQKINYIIQSNRQSIQ